MRIIELGNYIVPAFAGMVLAEAGHTVTKLANGADPILGLTSGDELWRWINHGKRVRVTAGEVLREALGEVLEGRPDIVIDNLTPSFLARVGIVPADLADEYNL